MGQRHRTSRRLRCRRDLRYWAAAVTPNPLPVVFEIIMFLMVATSDSSRASFDCRWMFSSAFLLITTDAGMEVIFATAATIAAVLTMAPPLAALLLELAAEGGEPGSGTIIFCSALVGHSFVEMPESRSSDEPSPSSQAGELDRWPIGSCLMFCRASSAVAASLSPRWDLCRSFTGRLLACSWISRSRSGSSSPPEVLPALAVEEAVCAGLASYGDGARRLRLSTFAVSSALAISVVRGGDPYSALAPFA
uniref:Uncharacterized protein n=1 Tax=Anopheles merus TaxID=30066 RepID=A0A182URG2_ANOME